MTIATVTKSVVCTLGAWLLIAGAAQADRTGVNVRVVSGDIATHIALGGHGPASWQYGQRHHPSYQHGRPVVPVYVPGHWTWQPVPVRGYERHYDHRHGYKGHDRHWRDDRRVRHHEGYQIPERRKHRKDRH